MPEYIEREAALALFDERKWQGEICQIAISDLPAADVAPVVHGRWIEHIDSYENYCECSVCHFSPDSTLDETPYCPHCGAKMDLE